MRRCTSAIALGILVLANAGWAQYHAADTSEDWQIQLGELLRVIQFFNSEGYHCDEGTEDGYAPGPGDSACGAHNSDYLEAADFTIELSELLRLVQFFNGGGYCGRTAVEDGWSVGVDITPPTLTLVGPAVLSRQCGQSYFEQGANIIDDCDSLPDLEILLPDGDLSQVGEYEILYRAADHAGHVAETVRSLTITDTQGPSIDLVGSEEVFLPLNFFYEDQGATATDLCDGAVPVTTVTNTVNTSEPGAYRVEYVAVDSLGHVSRDVRTVRVLNTESDLVWIYMSLDDRIGYSYFFTDPEPLYGELTGHSGAWFPIGTEVSLTLLFPCDTVITFDGADVSSEFADGEHSIVVDKSVFIYVWVPEVEPCN